MSTTLVEGGKPLPGAAAALRAHWPEYLMEAAELGLFMVSACLFVAWIEHPHYGVPAHINDPFWRRALIGLAMGLTAVAIVHSPLGKRSGAHFNPAVTLTFLRLGRIAPWDAAFYALGQFVGACAGVLLAAIVLGRDVVADARVNFVATLPGDSGVGAAFVAEALISFVLMAVVLALSNDPRLNRHTGVVAGVLVALFITFEAPYSGMSMNPARSFGSAWPGHIWQSLWLYFTAPPLGMLLAAELFVRRHGLGAVLCCKLHHENDARCIFRCRYGARAATAATPSDGGSA